MHSRAGKEQILDGCDLEVGLRCISGGVDLLSGAGDDAVGSGSRPKCRSLLGRSAGFSLAPDYQWRAWLVPNVADCEMPFKPIPIGLVAFMRGPGTRLGGTARSRRCAS